VCWWRWLAALRAEEREAIETFQLGMCGLPHASSRCSTSFFTQLYLDDKIMEENGVDQQVMITEGLDLFEHQFGFKSLSTVAPNVTWTDKTEQIWGSLGIRYFQGGLIQRLDISGREQRLHYLGQRNQHGTLYLVRNCFFEPSKHRNDSLYWRKTLAEVGASFILGKPAVISTHRVNYIGSISESNRELGLKQLSLLLGGICNRWPDVRFISSPELGYMIEHHLRNVDELEGKEMLIFPVSVLPRSESTMRGSDQISPA